MTLHSGERDVMVMGLGVFRRTWERAGTWALAFPPPGEFPPQVRERDALAAAPPAAKLKKSFQALQIDGAEPTISEKLQPVSTEVSNPGINTTQLSQTIMIPQKLSSSSSFNLNKWLMPAGILVLLGFFFFIFSLCQVRPVVRLPFIHL